MPEQTSRYVIRNGVLVPQAVQQELDRHAQLIDVLQADSKSDDSRLDRLEAEQPFFFAYLNVAIASYYPAVGTYTKIPTDTWGTGTNGSGQAVWSLVNDQMTITDATQGAWVISASMLENEVMAVGNPYGLALFVNGGEFQRMHFTRAVTATNVTASGAVVCWLQSGWTVDVRATVTSSAAKTAGAGYPFTHVIGRRLGP